MIENNDIEVLMEKNLHASRAGSKKIGKFSLPNFRRVENTKVRIIIMAKGFSKDQKNPRIEFRYLNLNSLTVKFLTSWPYFSNSHTLPILKVLLRTTIKVYYCNDSK